MTIGASGAAEARTLTLTLRARPGSKLRRFGSTKNCRASDSPVATELNDNWRRRVETFRTTIVRVECQRGPSQMPNPSVAGCAATSPTADAPSRNVPAPTADEGAMPRWAYPTSRLCSDAPSRAGRIWASSAAAPPTVAAAPLVPLIVP
jgi:hypothetical protein